MGTILSFARDSGQWSASERGRLEALMEKILGGDQDLHIAFGTTDDGAPWCAVTNDEGEVLVHVARLADRFMAHFVAEDVVTFGASLTEAFGKRIDAEPERMGVVVPFPRVHGGPDILALMAIAVLLEDHLKLAASLLQGEDGAPHEPSAAQGETVTSGETPETSDDGAETKAQAAAEAHDDAPPTTGGTTLAVAGAEDGEAAPAQDHVVAVVASAADVETSKPAAEIPAGFAPLILASLIKGGEGDDVLIGTARAEHLMGGPGDDVLIGGGGRDTLDGGDGDDWIVITAEAVATGGAGADTFVIATPQTLGQADTLLGTITDFREAEGDRLMTGHGELIAVGSQSDGATLTAADKDRRIEVDLDGDGRIDGYVLLAAGSSHADDHVPTATPGGTLGWTDFFG